MRMTTNLASIAFVLALLTVSNADTFLEGPNQFDIEFVTIGSPGNEPFRNDSGDVAYEYRMGKFEISRQQIQLANQLGGLEISIDDLGFLDGGPRPELPASGISTNEAARFVNWLNESKGLPHAYKFETQPGEEGYDSNALFQAWEPDEPGYNPDNILRNALAQYVVPTDQEWVKAAYYDPPAGDVAAAYRGGIRAVPGEQFNTWRVSNGLIVDVMAAGEDEVTGLVGMIGNVWEVNETPLGPDHLDAVSHRLRGGGSVLAFTGERGYGPNSYERQNYGLERTVSGFRVASVPEPSGCWLVGFAFIFALCSRKQRSTRHSE